LRTKFVVYLCRKDNASLPYEFGVIADQHSGFNVAGENSAHELKLVFLDELFFGHAFLLNEAAAVQVAKWLM
jgi:hypothetical protein